MGFSEKESIMNNILRDLDLLDRIADAEAVKAFLNKISEALYDDNIASIAERDCAANERRLKRIIEDYQNRRGNGDGR
jgi:hypothetical protein